MKSGKRNWILLVKVNWSNKVHYGEELINFYNQLNVLLSTTKYKHEAFPLVLFEALAHGYYIITFDSSSISDI